MVVRVRSAIKPEKYGRYRRNITPSMLFANAFVIIARKEDRGIMCDEYLLLRAEKGRYLSKEIILSKQEGSAVLRGETLLSSAGRREYEATKLALDTALNGISGMRTILDMPCGTGRYTSFSYEKGYLYFGADISVEMVKVMAGKGSSRAISMSLRVKRMEQYP